MVRLVEAAAVASRHSGSTFVFITQIGKAGNVSRHLIVQRHSETCVKSSGGIEASTPEFPVYMQ